MTNLEIDKVMLENSKTALIKKVGDLFDAIPTVSLTDTMQLLLSGFLESEIFRGLEHEQISELMGEYAIIMLKYTALEYEFNELKKYERSIKMAQS